MSKSTITDIWKGRKYASGNYAFDVHAWSHFQSKMQHLRGYLSG